MISELKDNYEKLLLKSLKEKNLLEKTNTDIERNTLSYYDENSWNALLNTQDDTLMKDAIDDLLSYTKHPIIEKKKLNDLRERSINEQNLIYSSNEKHSLGFQHSSAKCFIEAETNSTETTPSLANGEKGWSFSPIINNQESYSEMSTINQMNESQPKSRNDSAAGRIIIIFKF